MIIHTIVYPLVIVSLPTLNSFEIPIVKHDYTRAINDCQYNENTYQPRYKNIMEFNTMTNEELIQINHMKYQDVIPPPEE